MKLPLALEVPGVFRVRMRAELDGRPLVLDVRSGHARLRVFGETWAELAIAPDQVVVDLGRQAASRMFKEAGRQLGWLWLLKKSPGFMRAMQSFADQAETEVVFSIAGHPLARFAPGRRPSFSPGGLRGFWG